MMLRVVEKAGKVVKVKWKMVKNFYGEQIFDFVTI